MMQDARPDLNTTVKPNNRTRNNRIRNNPYPRRSYS